MYTYYRYTSCRIYMYVLDIMHVKVLLASVPVGSYLE